MSRRKQRTSGFTLLEVLLVLAILVIMGSTVTYYFIGAQQKANRSQALSQMSMFGQLLTNYHLDVGSYPTTAQSLEALRTPPAELAHMNRWHGPYADKDIPLDPWGNPYQYESDGTQYRIWSLGADGQNGTEDDVYNQ